MPILTPVYTTAAYEGRTLPALAVTMAQRARLGQGWEAEGVVVDVLAPFTEAQKLTILQRLEDAEDLLKCMDRSQRASFFWHRSARPPPPRVSFRAHLPVSTVCDLCC